MSLSDEEKEKASERIQELEDSLETDDVAQRRFTMYHFLNYLVDTFFALEDEESVEPEEKLEELEELDGHLYKISQDFLLASSTMEKENHLEKIIEKVSRKLS